MTNVTTSDEFQERAIRIKSRNVAMSEFRQWPLEEWVSWLKDGMGIFCSSQSKRNDRAHAFTPFLLMDEPIYAVDNSMVARYLKNSRLGAGVDVLGQAIIDVCASRHNIGSTIGGVNSATKADFLVTVCEELTPSRSVELIENIIRLHDEGWIDMSADTELISGCAYTLIHQADKGQPQENRDRLAYFLENYGSQITLEAFRRTFDPA